MRLGIARTNSALLSVFTVFLLVIHGDTVRLASGILYPSRVGAVGIEVTDLGNDTLRTDVNVLGVASALVGDEIRTYIEGESGGVGKASFVG